MKIQNNYLIVAQLEMWKIAELMLDIFNVIVLTFLQKVKSKNNIMKFVGVGDITYKMLLLILLLKTWNARN